MRSGGEATASGSGSRSQSKRDPSCWWYAKRFPSRYFGLNLYTRQSESAADDRVPDPCTKMVAATWAARRGGHPSYRTAKIS
jgi:hypothetical protein